MYAYIPRRAGWVALRTFVLIAAVFLSIVLLGTFFFFHNQSVTKAQLKETLTSIAAVGAMQFDGDRLADIRGIDDMETEAFLDAIFRLHMMRQNLPHIRHAYLMRRTEDPEWLTFIADADLYIKSEPVDENGNGIIDPEEELSYPGVPYHVEGVPALLAGFERPATDEDMTEDQWGIFLSGYAPVYDRTGEAVAILGIDMDAETFLTLSHSFFRPSVFLLVIILGAFLSAYVAVLFWRRRVEALREFDVERSALINLALHQLGAPLAIFRWWVEILRERYADGKDEECKEICTQLDQGIERMSQVISSLEEVGAMEHATLSRPSEPVTLGTILDGLDHLFEERVSQRDIALVMERKDADMRLYIDPKVVTGMLQELISNAIDYSPKHSVVSVETKKVLGGVEIAVRDNGCGIPKKDIPRLFTRFTRGSNAARMKPQGNGVGLFVVKQIVEKVKGKIWLESEEGKGTVVHLILPAKR